MTVSGSLRIQFLAEGVGKSKREAKNAAAMALTEMLSDLNAPGFVEDQNKYQKAKGYFKERLKSGNFVGNLQELCAARKLDSPKYTFEAEADTPHEKEFVYRCTVGRVEALGTGRSKKIAKQDAAQRMWHILEDSFERESKVGGSHD